jgi:hypothetical protein
MKVFIFMVAVGLCVALFKTGLAQIAPAGWWGG